MNVFGLEVDATLFWGGTTLLLVGALVLVFLGSRGRLRSRRSGDVNRLKRELGDLRFRPEDLADAGRVARREFGRAVRQMELSKWPEAAGLLRNALAAVKEDRHRSSLRNLVGICLYLSGRLDNAKDAFEEAARLAEGVGLKAPRAAALSNLGMVHITKGEMEEARGALDRALGIDRELGNRVATAADLGRLGLAFQGLNRADRALDLHLEALAIDRDIGDSRAETNDLGRIGLVYQTRGELDKAEEYYRQGLERARSAGYLQGTAELLGNLGLLHNERGNTDEALRHLLSALGLFTQARGESRVLNALSGLHAVRGRMGRDAFRAGCRKNRMSERELERLEGLLDRVSAKTPGADAG